MPRYLKSTFVLAIISCSHEARCMQVCISVAMSVKSKKEITFSTDVDF